MVVDEADGERDVLDAGGENVLLVEEQDRRRRREAGVIADGVEQRQAVVHCVLRTTTCAASHGRLQRNQSKRHFPAGQNVTGYDGES